jgi:hypothetical protein
MDSDVSSIWMSINNGLLTQLLSSPLLSIQQFGAAFGVSVGSMA